MPRPEAIKQSNVALRAEIKRRRVAEDELRQAHDLLDSRVGERTRQLQQSKERLTLALDAAEGALIDLDLIRGIYHYDDRAQTMLGYEPGELPLTRDHFFERVHPDDRAGIAANFEAMIRGDYDSVAVEFRQETKADGYIWTSATGRIVERDASGRGTRFVAIRFDISERKKALESLAHVAMHDSLTGLPNRAMLSQHLQRTCAEVACDGGQVAVFFIDLDHFKDVNDSLGHEAGDRLLRQVTNRLETCCLRDGEFLARLGGDEFAIIATRPGGADCFRELGNRIHAVMHEPHWLDGTPMQVSASLGIATFPEDSTDVDRLFALADLALYEAKKAGRGQTLRYRPAMEAEVLARVQIDQALRQALSKGQFVLYFQPIIGLDDLGVRSLEALIRWRDADGNLRSPKDFIAAAKRSNLIVPMTDWVIENAAGWLRTWRVQGSAPPPIALNLPTSHLEMTDSFERIRQRATLDQGREDDWIVEVTEDAFADDSKAITALDDLRALGVKIAIDDFGTGHSSMARLGTLPVDKLKIDRSFVAQFGKQERARAVLKAMTVLADSFDLETVIEGIETADEMAMVRDLGFDCAQGFLLARPMPADLVAGWLAQWRERSRNPEVDFLRRRL